MDYPEHPGRNVRWLRLKRSIPSSSKHNQLNGIVIIVILDVHPFFSTLIILSGWASKNVMSQLVGDWVGGDTQTSQAWLAYSIP